MHFWWYCKTKKDRFIIGNFDLIRKWNKVVLNSIKIQNVHSINVYAILNNISRKCMQSYSPNLKRTCNICTSTKLLVTLTLGSWFESLNDVPTFSNHCALPYLWGEYFSSDPPGCPFRSWSLSENTNYRILHCKHLCRIIHFVHHISHTLIMDDFPSYYKK